MRTLKIKDNPTTCDPSADFRVILGRLGSNRVKIGGGGGARSAPIAVIADIARHRKSKTSSLYGTAGQVAESAQNSQLKTQKYLPQRTRRNTKGTQFCAPNWSLETGDIVRDPRQPVMVRIFNLSACIQHSD